MKKYFLVFLTILVIIGYTFVQTKLYVDEGDDKKDSPVIEFNADELIVSVNATYEDLLSGVGAYDLQDGDITEDIIIEELTVFLGNHTRTISYVVFDSDDNITKATRKLTYKDYTAPYFVLEKQLRDEHYSVSEVTKVLKAYSCVDGDISNNITIMNTSFVNDNKLQLKISVSDSTNTTSYLIVNYYLEDERDIDIVLEDYLIYLKVGESFNYRNNIINIVEKLSANMDLVHSVNIDVPDMSEPGIYEVTYSLNRKNGNTGVTTMVVVVE